MTPKCVSAVCIATGRRRPVRRRDRRLPFRLCRRSRPRGRRRRRQAAVVPRCAPRFPRNGRSLALPSRRATKRDGPSASSCRAMRPWWSRAGKRAVSSCGSGGMGRQGRAKTPVSAFLEGPMRATRRRAARWRARRDVRERPGCARRRGRVRRRAVRRARRAVAGFRPLGARLSPRALVVVGLARSVPCVQAGASSERAFIARGGRRGLPRPVASAGASRRAGGDPSPRAPESADRGGVRGGSCRACAL